MGMQSEDATVHVDRSSGNCMHATSPEDAESSVSIIPREELGLILFFDS